MDTLDDAGGEEIVDEIFDNRTESFANAQPSTVDGDNEDTISESEADMEAYEGAYVQQCPALADEETEATVLGTVAKWTVGLATLDVVGFALDAGAEEIVDNSTESSTNAQPSTEFAVDSAPDSDGDNEADMEAYEGAYVQQCPALADEETEAYQSDQGEEEDVEDAADILETIQPYLMMAKAAYGTTSMSMEMIENSQLISNVIDPSHLFGGCVGTTDTEVHVCILDDESVVFAFRGTEPTEWRNGFADVLTDFAEGQENVKLYDGSSIPAYRSHPLIQAHRGFQLALKDVTDTNIPSQNLRLVLQQLGMQAEDVRKVVCVGHSLGGALATLCAKWCREVAFPGAEIGCVTIGSPRVGNVAFALDFNSRVVDGWSYRVVNKQDIVPCVPNLITYPNFGFAYKHVSKPIYLIENEAGVFSSRLGGSRPTLSNMNFFHHPCKSYLKSVKEVLQST